MPPSSCLFRSRVLARVIGRFWPISGKFHLPDNREIRLFLNNYVAKGKMIGFAKRNKLLKKARL